MLAGSAETAFVDREDILAHLSFLAEAYDEKSCNFAGSSRSFLFDVSDAGQFRVLVDATPGTPTRLIILH